MHVVTTPTVATPKEELDPFSSQIMGVVVPYNPIQRDHYQHMLREAGVQRVVTLDPYHRNPKETAERIADLVDHRKAIILSGNRRDMAYCYDFSSTSVVSFADDDGASREVWLENFRPLENGTAMSFRNGRSPVYVVGHRYGLLFPRPDAGNYGIKRYPVRSAQSITDAIKDQDVFLCLDLAALNDSETTAHAHPHNDDLDNLLRRFGMELHFPLSTVSKISSTLIGNNRLLGINISGYNPDLERPNFPTEGKLVEFLQDLLRRWRISDTDNFL